MTKKIIPVPNKRIKDLTGKRFGRLTVLGYIGNDKHENSVWLCACACGNVKEVLGHRLTSGRTQNCGCRHTGWIHGMGHSPEYKAWYSAIQRCTRPTDSNYHNYGGRGIKVCRRWRDSFEAFYEDMGPRPSKEHSLDRIDNDGNYEPTNCRWATITEQGNNRRTNNLITYQGRTMNIAQWSQVTGISISNLCKRIQAGWPVERALTEPVSRGKRWWNHATSKAK